MRRSLREIKNANRRYAASQRAGWRSRGAPNCSHAAHDRATLLDYILELEMALKDRDPAHAVDDIDGARSRAGLQ